ncbi:MAG TPA: O-antigen ligase family protein [Candidatus Dormibacteraeota bacterium]|nr:O-antigen ligase family protein [Candidatus Dormibacteraeota bacterium]
MFLPSLVDEFILPRTSLVIAGACLGAGFALLSPTRPSLGALRWPLLAAAAAAVLAFAFSISQATSFAGSYLRYESLPVRLAYLGLAAVPVWLLRDDRSRDRVVAAFVLGTSIACLEALQQFVTAAPFRPDGNTGNAGILGAMITMAVPLAISRALRGGTFSVAWWLGVVALVGGLYVSTSRAGGLGVVAGCLALVVVRQKGRVALVTAAGAAALVGLALLAIVVSPLRELNGDPGPARIHLWSDALGMLIARPLTGWGEDSTGLALGRFLTGQWAGPYVTFDRVHNGVLDTAVTQGVLGLAALGVVIGVVAFAAWKHRFSDSVGPLAAACVAYTVWVVFNFDWAPATGAFWLLLGTCWSAVRAAEADSAPARTAVPPWRVLGAVGVALVAIALAAMPVLADAWYAAGRIDLAVRVDPFQSQYHRALGEALIAQGDESGGVQELRLAGRLGNSDPGLFVELGDEELRQGDAAAARADYEMALKINPFWQPALQRLAGSSTTNSPAVGRTGGVISRTYSSSVS